MKRLISLFLVTLLLFGMNGTLAFAEAMSAAAEDNGILSDDSSDFVLLSDAIPDAVLETRYDSTGNSAGDRSDGREQPLAVRSPEAMLARMTTEEKIAQMLMPAFQGYTDEKGEVQKLTEMRPEIAETLKKHGFAGVIFFAANMADTEQAVRLVDAMQSANAAAAGRPQLLTAVDQEGGPVVRLGHGCQMTGNMALGAIGDPAAAEQAGRLIGEELSAVGVNYDAAPVVDVNVNPQNPVIGLRSFSDDPALVAQLGTALMAGIRSTGVISTLKHFPGHGDTATDSHTGLPRIEKGLDELKRFELIPFQACIDAGAEAIMTAHIQYPLIEKQTMVSVETGEEISLPATLSKTILTDLLRGEMDFDGVIISDAMNMDAIARHFEPLTVAQKAIEAGVNIILMPVDTSAVDGLAALDQYISDLAALVDEGTIPLARVNDSVLRTLRLKEKHGLLEPYDGSDLDGRVAHALETVGSEAHHAIEAGLAARALTLIKNERELLPLQIRDEKTLILVPLDSEVQSAVYAAETLKSEGKLPEAADVRAVSYSAFSKADLENVRHLIAVSAIYGAREMDPWTKDGAYSLLLDKVIDAVHEAGGDVTIVSAQLPYDAERFQDADAVVIAWYAKGMTEDIRALEQTPLSYGPNLPAALMQILNPEGVFPGTLPIKLPDVDADGQFVEQTQDNKAESEEPEAMRMKIGETDVEVVWEDNESVAALKELARDGLHIQMSMYGGFEQVGPIGSSLPAEDHQTTTQAGDIVLYSGNQLVIFYGSNAWAYTRLGRIADKSATELTELLGSGNVAVTLTSE